ncbi:hypothetical protein niasHS_000737 [Heterodera schachtii]|uniref:Uncharacterized protein n=1 Tax=Heterodera schachtii TaxID=97005 RepID=A0ABD2KB62_HETSC
MCFSTPIFSRQRQQQFQQDFATSFWSRLLCLMVPPLSTMPCRPSSSSIAPSSSSPSSHPQNHSDANVLKVINIMLMRMMMMISISISTTTKFSNSSTTSTSIGTATTMMNRCRTRRRMMARPKGGGGGAVATLIVLLTLSSIVLPIAQCATFFYGATEESDQDNNNVMNDENGQFDGARALALAESAAVQASNKMSNNHNDDDYEEEEEEARLSKQELHAVFNFCEILPQLQQQGFIPENKHARDICKKLVDMLKPMFRKRAAQSAHATSVPMPSRPRRHVAMATLFLQQRKR